MARLLDPKLLVRLFDAGAFDPRTAVGAAGSVPWLLGRGPSLGILSQIHATGRGSQVALIDREGELTWSELESRSNRLAHALGEMELRPGDRVATLLRNGRETVEAIIAGQKRGFEVAPLNTWAKPRELKTIIERSEPATLIYDPKHEEQVREALGGESLELGQKHGATAASFVPVMIWRMLSLSDEEREHDLSSLRIVLASGSAMSPDMRKSAMELFGEVLYDLYGSTEAGWVAIATPD